MQKVNAVPLSLAYSTNPTAETVVQSSENVPLSNEGYGQICRSAATIGLVITMGATGMLLLSQNEAAVAVESATNATTVTSLPALNIDTNNLPKQKAIANPATVRYVKLAPLAIKHQVKQGESLWELSKEYQIAPAAIAASNKISPQADLSVGQTLKIPSLKESDSSMGNRKIIKSYNSIGDESEQLNNSLKNLRETRKRLQTSLAQLKFRETQITNNSDFATAPFQIDEEERATRLLKIEENLANISELTSLFSKKDSFPPSDPLPVPVSAIANPRTPKPQETEEVKPLNDNLASSDRPVVFSISPVETAKDASGELKEPELIFPEVAAPKTENLEPTAKQAYRVRPGDNLNKIAKHNGVSVAALIRANRITNPNIIKVAQQLIIPQTDSAQKVDSNGTTISNAALNHDLPEASMPVVTASLAPVVIENTTPQKAAERSDETPDLEQESSTLPNTEKLMADIDRLQQEYANESRPNLIAERLKIDANSPSNTRTINPEWVGERQFSPERSPLETRNTPPLPTPRNSQNSQPKAQLVGAALTNTGQYNDIMRVPVGETVGPELPPLSSPDDYLPDTPMKFTGYMWPARGVLTSGYGWRWGRMHKGVDIAAPIGTPIMAAAPGEVVSAGWNSGGYGNLVKVKHADGSLTLYAHNSKILVRQGQMVEQGEQIAEMGSTGFSTGPHLHFEIHPNGQKAVNPMAYLPKERS
jgi:murein DD-endopeptidase MepM/ murein hydrolase activator NlpD